MRIVVIGATSAIAEHCCRLWVQREACDLRRRVMGQHPQTAFCIYVQGAMAALQGHTDEALAHLRDAVDHGLLASVALGIEADPDLQSLHGDSRFAALVARSKERAAEASH